MVQGTTQPRGPRRTIAFIPWLLVKLALLWSNFIIFNGIIDVFDGPVKFFGNQIMISYFTSNTSPPLRE
jgi:hypothetical protein